jgi:hypothetical protein
VPRGELRQTIIVGDTGNVATVDSAGNLQVDIVSGGATATEYTEGDTDTTITGIVTMGEAPSDTVEALQLTASTNLKISIEEDNVGIGGGTQYTEGAVDATITGNAMLAEAPSDTIEPLQLTASNHLQVSLEEDNVGTTGNVAHDAVDSGNPLKVGYKTIAHGSNPTAVAAADRTDAYANRHGIPFMIGGHPNVVVDSTNFTAAQTDTKLVTIAAGNKIIVTKASVYVDNACSVDVAATITTTITKHPGIAAGSGFVEGSGSGIIAIGADDEDLIFTCEVPTGGSIQVNISYYTVES